MAGTVAPAAALHGRWRGACRSDQYGGYGPWFDEPRAPGEREREQGISARPIQRPEDAAEAAVTMVGGRELSGARE